MTEETPSYEPELLTEETDEEARPKLGPWQRIVRVFWAPAEVFEDIRRRPTWVLPLLGIMLLSLATQMVAVQHIDLRTTLMERMESRNTEISEEQLDRAVEVAEKMKYLGPVAGLLIVPVAMAALAGIFLVSIRTTGGETDFRTTFSSMLHAYWPPSFTGSVLGMVLFSRAGALPQDELQRVVKSNLGAFLSADAPRWQHALAGSVDIFNLWTIALLVMGFSIVARISRGRAAVAVLVPWGAYILVKVGLAMIFGGM